MRMLLRMTENNFLDSLIQRGNTEANFVSMLEDTGRLTPSEQIAIYKSHVNGAHSQALRQTYNACRNVLGDDCFEYLCRVYRLRYPSMTPDLNQYGGVFSRFLLEVTEKQPAFFDYGYLHDLADLEWAWHQAYLAENNQTFNYNEFALVDAVEYERLFFDLNNSLSMHQSEYPVRDIWQANRLGDGKRQQFRSLTTTDYFCVVRDGWKPCLSVISEIQYHLLSAVKDDMSFAELAERYPLEIQSLLLNLLSRKWITGFRIEN